MKKVSILVLVSFIFNCGEVLSSPRNSRVRASGGRRAFVRSAGSENAGGVAVQTQTEETVSTSSTFDADISISGEEVNTVEVREKIANLQQKISEVRSECSGIKNDLDTMFGFTTATTATSGLGGVAAGGALVTGIIKAKTDKELEDLSKLSSVDLYNYALSLENEEKKTKLEKKSKTLGNVRTGLMAGATVTSVVSTGTSIGATVNADKLAKKMSDCNQKLYELKIAKSELDSLEATDKSAVEVGENATKILSVCTGYNKNNIDTTVKNKMIASAIISGIGTATGATGTITSAMANSKKVREDDSVKGQKKEKNLNLTANIMAGITTGTSLSTTVISATAIADAQKDSKMAEKCEAVLK